MAEALADIRDAWRYRQTAFAFAAEDVADLYRRTWLGPIWLIISFLMFVMAIVFVAGSSNQAHYVGFVAIGYTVFSYLSEVISEGVALFRREKAFITGTTLPITLYVLRLASRTAFRGIYTLVACLGLVLYSGLYPNSDWLFSALAIGLILVTTPAAALVFAVIGALLPDTTFIVQNIMRLAFFLTPVFWTHSGSKVRALFYWWNPFTHFIEIVREPILTGDPALFSWGVALAITAGLWAVALLLLGIYRNRIVFLV